MLIKEKYYIGIDLGKTFGYSVWKEDELLSSGEIKMKEAHKPWEMKSFLQKTIYLNLPFEAAKNPNDHITLIVETGQGFSSKNAFRSFGVQTWLCEDIAYTASINYVGIGVSRKGWKQELSKEGRIKTNENDAIDIVKFFKKNKEEVLKWQKEK